MDCALILSGVAKSIPYCNSIQRRKVHGARLISASSVSNLRVSSSQPRCSPRGPFQFTSVLCSLSSLEPQSSEDDEDPLSPKPLRVPDHWLDHSRASQESEWLRVTLHKWLDDEYCPEETNVEISEVAARTYHKCLMNKSTDLGGILLRMGRALQSISYEDSFHGAYSSANAAIELIAQRVEQESMRDETEG